MAKVHKDQDIWDTMFQTLQGPLTNRSRKPASSNTIQIFFKDPLKDNMNTEIKNQLYIHFHLYLKILQTEHLTVYILYLFNNF